MAEPYDPLVVRVVVVCATIRTLRTIAYPSRAAHSTIEPETTTTLDFRARRMDAAIPAVLE